MAQKTAVVDVYVERHYRVELARPILEDVRWRIEKGQHWALIGKNGSGKSTLLDIVSGDLWPSRGTITVLGEEYGKIDKRELRKRIGVVSSTLFSGLPSSDTGLEIAASGVRARIGRLGPLDPEDLERGRRALLRLSAEDCAKKPYSVLSQGEKQRVMIARALVNDPALLILDEPANGLDPVARENFLADLGELAKDPRGPTQIHVTHHLEEVPPFMTHALVLRSGHIVGNGAAEDVLTSECLSHAFDAPCRVDVEPTTDGRRFRLWVTHGPGDA